MSKSYSAEIVGVGTELLLGQIANTNAQWISQKLADLGIHVYFHSVVGDNLERVKTVLQQAGHRSDIVIVTGGLGPTDDDLTREAFQELSGYDLAEDQSSMKKIEKMFNQAGREMTSNNRKQSLVFEESLVFNNPVGMAPGIGVSWGSKKWYFLPGVPREMKAIMIEGIIPEIKNSLSLTETIKSRMLRFIGIGESRLEHDLKELIEGQSNPTIAPLAAEGEVTLRLTAKSGSVEEASRLIDQAEANVLEIAGKYFYGYDEDYLNKKVIQLLNERNLSITAAESFTGGKFIEALVSVPGASSVVNGGIVCYSSESKQKLLDISSAVLEKEGTISGACAREMAVNARRKIDAGVGLGFTGVAGPAKEEGHAPGTVYIALDIADKGCYVESFHFNGDRETVRNRAVKKALELLFFQLNY